MDKVNEMLLELGMALNSRIDDSDFRELRRNFLVKQSKENLNENESKKVLLKLLSDICFGFYINDVTKHYKLLDEELRKEFQKTIETISVQFNGTEFESEIYGNANDPEYILIHFQNAIRRMEPSWEVRAIFMTRMQQQVEVMNVLKREVHRLVEKANVFEHLSSALLAEM